MKEWKQSLLRVQEDGMEAIEGLLVITLTLFVLFFIWGYGFLLFQQFVVIRAADETANKIAQTYAYAETDPITGYISKEVKVALSPSRYQSGKLQEKNEQRAIKYGKWLVRKGSLATQVGMPVHCLVVARRSDAHAVLSLIGKCSTSRKLSSIE